MVDDDDDDAEFDRLRYEAASRQHAIFETVTGVYHSLMFAYHHPMPSGRCFNPPVPPFSLLTASQLAVEIQAARMEFQIHLHGPSRRKHNGKLFEFVWHCPHCQDPECPAALVVGRLC